MRRWALLTCAALLGGCGGGNLASQLAETPEFDPANQTKCKVQKSQHKPLIVEWPSADRADLEAQAQTDVVVVAYDGCEMRLLSRCTFPGKYEYRAVTPKQDTIRIRNEDELWANIPLGAAKLEGKLATSGQLNVAMTMVGTYTTDVTNVGAKHLKGDCEGATHLVVGLTVGAFEFFAGAEAEVGAGVDVAGAGAGAKSTAKREVLTRDGDPAACDEQGEESYNRPPTGCGAFLRVEVAPLIDDSPRQTGKPSSGAEAEAPEDVEGDNDRWRPAPEPPFPNDRDGDRIPDAQDQCPAEAEDRDGYEDDDGCPERDNDGDGIDDTRDRCPSEAEDINGIDDEDGCADADKDGDGVVDARDECPDVAEDSDGVKDHDGCPEKE